jgi:hypothetical protein
MLVHDLDGAGPLPPQFIVGGLFERAGGAGAEGILARNIAAWNGTNWTTLGSGFNDLGGLDYGGVHSLVSYGGTLYATGNFGIGQSSQTINVARFDGTNWQNTGVVFDGPVFASTVYAGELVVAGTFTGMGPVTARNIAAWNGVSWRPLASGLRGRRDEVRALAVFGGELIAAGSIDTAGAISTPGIARWNGSRWTSLGSGIGTGFGEEVRALALHGGELIAAGAFRSAGGAPIEDIARWNGTRWASMPDLEGTIEALTVWNGDLIATGFLDSASDTTIRTVARWNGSQWTSFGETNQVLGLPESLGVFGSTLYVGGTLNTASGVDVKGLTAWNGTSWISVPGLIEDDTSFPSVSSLANWNGDLIAGGLFRLGGASPNLLRWSGNQPTPSGAAPNGAVLAMLPVFRGANIPDDLVVAGAFTQLGFDDPHSRVATLAPVTDGFGRITRPMGSGFNNTVRALARFNGQTVAAGDFTASGGTAINRLARFDGTNWQPFDASGGLNGGARALKTFSLPAQRLAMVVGGSFTTAGGVAANRIAQYTFTTTTGIATWSAFGPGFNGTVEAVERFGGVIYAGGSFNADGNGQPLNFVARFVSGAWQQVGAGFNGSVSALYTDGTFLYAGGTFTASGATAVTNLARWDGSSWTPVDGGANGRVSTIFPYQGELAVGGFFTRVGPGSSGGPTQGAIESHFIGRYTLAGQPWFSADDQPTPTLVCRGGVGFMAGALATGYDANPGLIRVWRRNGVPIAPGPTPHGSSILIDTSGLLIINARDEDAGVYDCVVTTSCGDVTSRSSSLAICPVDINCDNFVDFFDYDDYVAAFESGGPVADFNRDGFLDFFDYDAFVGAFESGC